MSRFFMYSIFLAATMTLPVWSADATAVGKNGNGFEILIEQKKEAASADKKDQPVIDKDKKDQWKPIFVAVAVINRGKNEAKILRLPDVYDVDLVVKNTKGKPVPRTAYGSHVQKMGSPPHFSLLPMAYHSIAPGQSIKYEINLSRQFDLSMPGTYFVQASRFIEPFGENKSGSVTSDKLKIVVK